MTSEAPLTTNSNRGILRSSGQKRVRIATSISSTAEDTTTEFNFTPETAPSIDFKTAALKSLSTHLPQLHEFLKTYVESFGSTFANVFPSNSNLMRSWSQRNSSPLLPNSSSSSCFLTLPRRMSNPLPSFQRSHITWRTHTKTWEKFPTVPLTLIGTNWWIVW